MNIKHLVFALAFAATPVWADAEADAAYIVEQTVTRDLFEAAISAQRPVIIGALQNDFREKGISVSDPERVFDLFIEEWIVEFTEAMRAQSSAIYLELFSSNELEEIAAFFRTDTGQAYIAGSPELMQRGAEMGQKAGFLAGVNAGPRLAKRIEEEGLSIVEDPGLFKQIIDALK